MSTPPDPRDDLALRRARARARRMALWVALVAVAVYVGFLAIGVLSK